VTQIALDGTSIHAIIRQFVAAAMPQHVRVDLHIEARRTSRTFHHGLKAAYCEWRASSSARENHRRLYSSARRVKQGTPATRIP
jgi:hypothetical protein